MRFWYLKEKLNVIDSTINEAKKVSENNPKLNSMLASYLVVFICGVYEDCLENLFIERADISKDEELKNFVIQMSSKHFRNPNYETIKGWINYFNSSYGSKLDSKLKNESKEAINSIVTNKNKIAHGQGYSITIDDIIKYHNEAKKIFQALEDILLPERIK